MARQNLEQLAGQVARLVALPALARAIPRAVDYFEGVYTDSVSGEIIGDEIAYRAWLGPDPAPGVPGYRCIVFELERFPDLNNPEQS